MPVVNLVNLEQKHLNICLTCNRLHFPVVWLEFSFIYLFHLLLPAYWPFLFLLSSGLYVTLISIIPLSFILELWLKILIKKIPLNFQLLLLTWGQVHHWIRQWMKTLCPQIYFLYTLDDIISLTGHLKKKDKNKNKWPFWQFK